MPPHVGHRYLISFALRFGTPLYVLVCTLDDEPIPGELRYRWVKEMVPDAEVIHVTERMPGAARGEPGAVALWADAVRSRVKEPITRVFASESYGADLAEELSARFIPVDPSRSMFPVSASRIRENPFREWAFIPPVVRPYFVKRIAVVDMPSEGHLHLAEVLADHFGTAHTGDYLSYRESLHYRNGMKLDDAEIFRGIYASEYALAAHADRVLLCAGPPSFAALRLKTDEIPKLDPFHSDYVKTIIHLREHSHDAVLQYAKQYGDRDDHIVLEGPESERFRKALEIVNRYLHP